MTQFPHAVLEVKLQLASGAEQPEWVTELLHSGYLREVPKFSKFVHGTAVLHRPTMAELPYWWSKEMMPLWAEQPQPNDPIVALNTNSRGLMLWKTSADGSVRLSSSFDHKQGWIQSPTTGVRRPAFDTRRSFWQGFWGWLITCGSDGMP